MFNRPPAHSPDTIRKGLYRFVKKRVPAWPTGLLCLLFVAVLPSQSWSSLQFTEAVYGGPVLDGAYGATVSPDGRNIYVAGNWNGTIAIYTRDDNNGQLLLAGIQRDGVDGVDGLSGVIDIAVSPDGRHLYAVGDWDDGLAVFERNSTTGLLTFVEVQKSGVNGVEGVEGAVSVVVSPDNRHVYVSSWLEDSVAVFSRDTTSGRLTFTDIEKDGVDGVDGIYWASVIALSGDGEYLYVTGELGSLAVFHRDSATGSLSFVESHFDDTNGVDGIDGAHGVGISPDGSYLYVAGADDYAVALFSRDSATGRLTFVQAFSNGTGTPAIRGLEGAYDIAISPDGNHLYVPGYYLDNLAVFSRDSTTGSLSFVQVLEDDTAGVDGLCGANSVVVSPDGAHVYVSGEFDNGTGVFSRDHVSGQLSFVGLQQDRYEEADGLYGIADVTVSPDGRHVYTAAGYDDDSVAVFSRDSGTGELTFVEALKDGENGVDGLYRAQAVLVSPDGLHLYAAGYGDDAIAVFERDTVTGRLAFQQVYKDGVGGVDGLDGATAIVASADGTHIYVAGYTDNAVAVFSRDASSGLLTFVEIQRDGNNGVDGLYGSSSLSLSADGRHLYVAGRRDSAVAVFNRNADNGSLTFVEMEKDGLYGVDGIYGVQAVTLSTDGAYLYTASRYDDAVAVFERDSDTGALTFLQMEKDGTGGVDGLNGACDLVITPFGRHLFGAGTFDDAVSGFSRNVATGLLTFEEIHQDGSEGVDGLYGVTALAMSPDGYHLYAAGEYDSAIAVFEVDSDNDGQVDANDPFPLDPSETDDTDGDGIGDNTDTDDDGDGVTDDNDSFPLDPNETVDTDGDGIGNNTDTDDDGDGVADDNDSFPLDPNETVDTDGDGIGNNTDTDDDGDGVADAVETAGSESGDGNGDGIADSLQNNVVTLETYGGSQHVTIASPIGTTLNDCMAAGNPSPENSPADTDFTYGFFSFTVNGVSSGGNVALSIYLPSNAAPDTYYKFGPTPTDPTNHWYEFQYDGETGAEISQNIVTLHLVDGQRGDDVLIADSKAVDIGAPAFESSNSSSSSRSGGGGGGCFITTMGWD